MPSVVESKPFSLSSSEIFTQMSDFFQDLQIQSLLFGLQNKFLLQNNLCQHKVSKILKKVMAYLPRGNNACPFMQAKHPIH
uniref:Uncharacterized protein n=1 Tax=Anguilla anguilla TaxID=7936 RepID=A0A0E9PKT6_ANGAN